MNYPVTFVPGSALCSSALCLFGLVSLYVSQSQLNCVLNIFIQIHFSIVSSAGHLYQFSTFYFSDVYFHYRDNIRTSNMLHCDHNEKILHNPWLCDHIPESYVIETVDGNFTCVCWLRLGC